MYVKIHLLLLKLNGFINLPHIDVHVHIYRDKIDKKFIGHKQVSPTVTHTKIYICNTDTLYNIKTHGSLEENTLLISS